MHSFKVSNVLRNNSFGSDTNNNSFNYMQNTANMHTRTLPSPILMSESPIPNTQIRKVSAVLLKDTYDGAGNEMGIASALVLNRLLNPTPGINNLSGPRIPRNPKTYRVVLFGIHEYTHNPEKYATEAGIPVSTLVRTINEVELLVASDPSINLVIFIADIKHLHAVGRYLLDSPQFELFNKRGNAAELGQLMLHPYQQGGQTHRRHRPRTSTRRSKRIH